MGYTIDTAATIRSLEAAGIQPEQASAIVNAIIQSDETLATHGDVMALNGDVGALQGDVTALKSDVTVLKSDVTVLKSDVTALKADLKTLEVDLRAELKALEARISMRLYTCAVGIVGLVLAAQLFASDFLG